MNGKATKSDQDLLRSLHRRDKIRLLIPHRFKRFVISILTSSVVGFLISKIYGNVIPHRGLKLKTTSGRISNATKAMLYWGIYERSEIDQAEAYYQPGFDVIELGASIGANTMQIVRFATGKVVAVEADPELVSILKENLQLNFGPNHGCQVANVAIDYSGQEFVKFHRGNTSLRGSVSSPGTVGGDFFQVQASTLRNITDLFGIQDYILVLDIEGAEVGLLIEEQESLRSCFRIIGEFEGGEYVGKNYSITMLVERLHDMKFTLIYAHANRMVFENRVFDGQPFRPRKT